MDKYKKYIGFGIAGNFANHLDQAGEAKDFVNVKVEEKNAPKGIFPFYLQKSNSFLSTYPLSNNEIVYPKDIKDGNLQAEPEVGLICELVYENEKVIDIVFKEFCAYNDCSIRKPNANKISNKKNWGVNTKGISNQTIKIDKFEKNGIMDDYYIASFLKRDGKIEAYGEDSSVLTYNYFYTKLKNWIINKLNTQKDEGPLEDLSVYLKQNNFPKNMVISIGATAYTPYGEKIFLQKDDEVFVIIYNKKTNSYEDIKSNISNNITSITNASVLHQKVI